MHRCFQVRLTNEVNADICYKYWSIGDDLRHHFTVQELQNSMGLTQPAFTQLVISSSELECRCEACFEHFKTYRHRSELNKDRFDYQKNGYIVCRSCWIEFGKSTLAQQIAAENKELKELVVKLTQDVMWLKKEVNYWNRSRNPLSPEIDLPLFSDKDI